MIRVFWLALLLGSAGLVSGFSQDLILKNGDTVVNNDSIFLSGTKNTELIEISLSITNNRSSAVSLKLKKTEIFMVEGAESGFCWGECYAPSVFVSPMSISILPGATDRKSFIGDYRPFGSEGTSIIMYTFFSPSDTTFQQSVTVFYQIGASGTDQAGSVPSPAIFPNPADRYLQLTFSAAEVMPRLISMVNIRGEEVLRRELSGMPVDISVPTADLPTGLYFLRILGKGGEKTVFKVLVSH